MYWISLLTNCDFTIYSILPYKFSYKQLFNDSARCFISFILSSDMSLSFSSEELESSSTYGICSYTGGAGMLHGILPKDPKSASSSCLQESSRDSSSRGFPMLSQMYYKSIGTGRLTSSSEEEEEELDSSAFPRLSEIYLISFLNCSTLKAGVSVPLRKSVDDQADSN